MYRTGRGFTIVELLIVIVVIALLATVTMVSYNGAQARAEFARAQTDMKHIDDALQVYRAQNGNYPIHMGYVNAKDFLDDYLAPGYLDGASILTAKTGYAYIYATDEFGTDYSLLRIKGSSINNCTSLPPVESGGNPLMKTGGPVCPNVSWGYWSSPGVANW